MITYILKSIKKYSNYFAFMVLGLFIITSFFPLAINSLFKTKYIVKDDISKYGRGAYDLLIRDESNVTDTEKRLTLIDENYVFGGKGGISLKDYEEIKKLENIEVAAPISNLGYFNNNYMSIGIKTPKEKINKITVEHITYDGIKEYSLGEQQLVNFSEKYRSGATGNFPIVISQKVSGYGLWDGFKSCSFKVPDMWYNVAAIDWVEENKLSDIKSYVKSGKYLEGFDGQVIKTKGFEESKIDTYNIPVLINKKAMVPLKMKVTIEEVQDGDVIKEAFKKLNTFKSGAIGLETLEGQQAKETKEVFDKLTKLESEKVYTKIYDLNESLKVFEEGAIGYYIEYGRDSITKEDSNFTSANGSLVHQVPAFEYEGDRNGLKPKVKSINSGMLIFGDIASKGYASMDIGKGKDNKEYLFTNIGEIDIDSEKDKEKLNGSPLGIYGDNSIKQVKDEKGNEVDRVVKPTAIPGTIGGRMPDGYTTLEAASLIKGDKPIDAIRVKVKGIASYNEESKRKIEKIAKEINEKTGLRVDTVAGSSTMKIMTTIEGTKDYEGMGTLVQRWVTLGTAMEIVSTWDSVAFILVLLFTICAALFIVNRINSYMVLRKKEMETLAFLGWDKGKRSIVIAGENVIAYLLASLFTVALCLKLKVDLYLLGTTLGVGLILTALISFIYCVRYKGNKSKEYFTTRCYSLVSLIFNDIYRNRRNYYLIITQVSVTGALAIFTTIALYATRDSINYTSLGAKINVSTESIVKAIVIGAIFMILFTIYDRFSSLILQRNKEIVLLKTLGWDNDKISVLVYSSLTFVSIVGTILALTISLLAGFIMYGGIPVGVGKIIVIALAIILVCMVGGIIPVAKGVNKSVLKYYSDER